MMKKVILKHIYEICYKILRIFIVSTIFWILANAIPETIPTPSLTEKLIDSIYYTGRKVSKITYEDLKRKSLNQTLTQIQEDFEILGNYYYEYIKQVNAMKEDLEFEKKKINVGINEINFNRAKMNSLNNIAKEEIQVQQKTFQDNSNSNMEKDEKNIFLNGFHILYGNKTIFKLEIQDVINLVDLGIIEENQAVFLWESLLLKKSQMKKRKTTENSEIEFEAEFFLFNFIPVKSVGLMIINIIIFLISYKIIRIGVIYNSFCILFTYYLLDNFYKYRYYGNSFISFITFVFCMKHIFFSIICRFNLKQEDIDIFTDKSKSVAHFFLKICGLVWVTLIIAIFSYVKFKLFMNYVIFYFGIILIINHVTEYLKYDVAAIFQPFKYFTFVSVGLINFLITNFHRKISKFNYPQSDEDLFYFVSEIFSFFCISYLYEYLFTQANNISHLLFERNEGSEEFNKKLNQVSKEYKEQYKTFSFEDSLWILLFLIGYGIFYMAISFSQYVTYIFGLYYLKMIVNAFGRIYKVKILRCFYSYLIFSLILINHIVTLKNDEKITSFFNYFNLPSNIISSQQNISTFFRHLIRFIGVVYIIIIIFSNVEFIYLTQEQAAEQRDKNYDTIEKDKIKNMHISATFEKKKRKNLQIEFQIVKEEKTRFNFKNIIYIHFDLYSNYLNVCLIFYFVKDVEKNLFIMMGYFLLLFLLLSRIYFVISEFKNDLEFFYAYLISFFCGIRLLTISRGCNSLYFISCINLLVLVVIYSLLDKKRIFITCLLFFHLYSACVYLGSNYLFILIISLFCLPLAIAFDEINTNCSMIRFFFPGVVVLIFQLYGFKNVYGNMLIINEHINNFFKFDIFGFVQSIVHGNYISEMNVISVIYNAILFSFNNQENILSFFN